MDVLTLPGNRLVGARGGDGGDGAGLQGTIPRRADRGAIRRNNLEVIARHLSVAGRARKASIAAETGLTGPTVARLVAELTDLGLVRAAGGAESSGVGRPSPLVEIDGSGLLAVGCEVNVHRMNVLVCDLGGRVRARAEQAIHAGDIPPATATRWLAGLCHQAVEQVASENVAPTIVSVAAAVPGLVDTSTGTVLNAPNLHWRGYRLAEQLRLSLDWDEVPVTVGNDANFAVLAEFWTGASAGTRNMVYVTGDVGIGGGILIDGRLLQSARGQAGEVGHVTLDPMGPRCECGRRGCWEALIGQGALQRTLGSGPPSTTAASFADQVAERAAAADSNVLAALADIGRWVGIGVANLVNVLGSDTVILGGYFARIREWVLPTAREALNERLMLEQPLDGLLATSTLGFDAASAGAALSILDGVLANPTRLHTEPRFVVPAG
jgi:predicted NBD/HSP70 family sugar kinase